MERKCDTRLLVPLKGCARPSILKGSKIAKGLTQKRVRFTKRYPSTPKVKKPGMKGVKTRSRAGGDDAQASSSNRQEGREKRGRHGGKDPMAPKRPRKDDGEEGDDRGSRSSRPGSGKGEVAMKEVSYWVKMVLGDDADKPVQKVSSIPASCTDVADLLKYLRRDCEETKGDLENISPSSRLILCAPTEEEKEKLGKGPPEDQLPSRLGGVENIRKEMFRGDRLLGSLGEVGQSANCPLLVVDSSSGKLHSPLKSQSSGGSGSHLGKHEVNMTTEGVLAYLCSFQKDKGKLRDRDRIHTESDLLFELQGREEAISVIEGVLKDRMEAFSCVPRPDDRMKFPYFVCSGMPGLGKTRMLEEWPSLFDGAGIPQQGRLGCLISYGNGHSVQDFESSMPIEASFSWRLLHRLFVETNAKDQFEGDRWFGSSFLPKNAEALSLNLCFKVVLNAARECNLIGERGTLSLFIGIDEYQKIPLGPDYREGAGNPSAEREKSLLWKLLAAMGTCNNIPHVNTYVGFAGTKWGPLSLANSSTAHIRRAPLGFLPPQRMEEAVLSHGCYKDFLSSPQSRRELFFLGGLPRPSLELVTTKRDFNSIFQSTVIEKWGRSAGLPKSDLLRLVVVALSRRKVAIDDLSGISNLKWGRLADEGLCLWNEHGDIEVPYSVLRLVCEAEMGSEDPLVNRCIVQNLRYLRDHIDSVLYDMEPWQLWERFGAVFFALQVNSLLMFGEKKIPFSRLCANTAVNDCSAEIIMCPMEVHAIEEHIGTHLGKDVTETMDRRKLDWVNGDARDGGHVRYALLNGTSGHGVDVFSALPLADVSGGVLLYLDQRKVSAASLGTKVASQLIEKARAVLPSCLPPSSHSVVGIFSLLASFNCSGSDLPENSFVLSYPQHADFHGFLSSHPACNPHVDVNFANVSSFRLLASVKGIARDIVKERERRCRFDSVDEFSQFCASQGPQLSDEDRDRVVAYVRRSV